MKKLIFLLLLLVSAPVFCDGDSGIQKPPAGFEFDAQGQCGFPAGYCRK